MDFVLFGALVVTLAM